MKTKIFYILILVAFLTFLYFYNNPLQNNTKLKCPDDYAIVEEQDNALEKWTNNFYDSHPGATLAEWSEARHTFWIENNCVEALKRYNEAKSGKADPATMKLIKDTIKQTYGE